MKILHIDTEKYWRGGQQQVLYLHEGLLKRKIDSLLICNKNSELKKKCDEKNLPIVAIPIFGEIDIFSAFRISLICRRNKINIVHAHTGHALTIAIFVKILYPELKLIASRRVDFPIKKSFFSRLKYNNRKIDKIVCVSEFIKKVLFSDVLEKEKLEVIRSGVDINKFDHLIVEKHFRDELGIKDGEFLLGTVAAFAGHKDYPNLLNAFALTLKKLPNIKLCIVGDGPLKKDIEGLIIQLGISDKVIMPGFIEEVGKYLKSFDLFILSSKKEGLGTSIIDALAVGLPIIATRAGGIPELISDGYNGILVEIQNYQALSTAMIDLLNNNEKRELLAKNAHDSVEKFSIDNTVENNISLYKALLNRSDR